MSLIEAKFGAYLSGGLVAASPETVNSLALIFDRIYVPFNPLVMRKAIDLSLKEFRRVRKIETNCFFADLEKAEFIFKENSPIRDFSQLRNLTKFIGGVSAKTKEAAADRLYRKAVLTIALTMYFYEQALSYLPLYPEIMHVTLFEDGSPAIFEELPDGMWRCTAKSNLILPIEKEDPSIDQFADKNYFPVATSIDDLDSLRTPTMTRSLATLLAMRCIEMFLPEVGLLDAFEVLEARSKLMDNLQGFWAGMLRLSKQLRQAASATADVFGEAQELVDSEVLPAILELKKQMEAERKTLFARLLVPLQCAVRFLVGMPLANPTTLAVGAMDASMSLSRTILKSVEANNRDEKRRMLAFLLQLPEVTKNRKREADMTKDRFSAWIRTEF
jgi:truncated hemoglobin YjbI